MSYLLQLLWMFTGGLFFYVFSPRQQELVCGKQEVRWPVWTAILMVLPYILWAGFRTDYFGDTHLYRLGFLNAPASLAELPAYLQEITKGKGFSVFIVLLKSLIGNRDTIYFTIIAAIQMICIASVFRRYSCDYWLSVFLFIASSDYLSWMHNGMRQFLAVALIYAATRWLLHRRYFAVIAVILLAATIHSSVLLMIPIIFVIQGKAFNYRAIAVIVLAVLVLAYVDRFTNFLDNALSDTIYKNVVSDWTSWGDDGTNPIRVLIYSVPTILAFVGYRWIQAEDDPVINLSVNASIVSTALYLISMVTSGIFIGRLPIMVSLYSTGILLPWEIEHLFSEESARIVRVIAVVLFCLLYYYQMHFIWGAV